MKLLALGALFVLLSVPLRAQTIDDGIMLVKHDLFTGYGYSYDSWDNYWEGPLKRVNGNVGTVTTQTSIWSANYGLTDRLNVLATLPYVWTGASQGVLHGMRGLQDLSLAGKYSLIDRASTKAGALRVIGVLSAGIPLTNYSPDLLPLSIGLASTRVAGRLTLNLQADRGWFANGSTAYTWRTNVLLDRPYYYTDGQLFLTDEVAMPNLFDYVASAGYLKRGLMTSAFFSQQRTLGGGDIRRQDLPFLSNRMNFSRLGGMVMYPLPKLPHLAFQAAYAYTLDGRNVGQAATFTTGVQYSHSAFGRAR